MITLDETQVRRNLPWQELIAAIEHAVADRSVVAPPRLAYDLNGPGGGADGHLLIMPAWRGGAVVGIKTLTIWPHDAHADPHLPSHGGNYILIDSHSGAVQAVLDGAELTARRTAAVSVVAARRLMRPDARRLLIVGTGPVARNLALAHSAVNGFERIEIYGRDPSRAQALTAQLRAEGVPCAPSPDLTRSAGEADMVAMATGARSPVLLGEWLREGTHVDLIGSYKPVMREADDTVFRRADAVWIDTENALVESGDLLQPLASGALEQGAIRGDLRTLIAGGGRKRDQDITLFKAVGFAVPDLAAAQLAVSAAVPEMPEMAAANR